MTEAKVSEGKKNTINFIAGLIGGMVSVTVCNPLDITRTRLNAMVFLVIPYQGALQPLLPRNGFDIQERGFEGFLRGYSPCVVGYKTNIIAIPMFHSLFFPIYEGVKGWCRDEGFAPVVGNILSSLTAGAVCNCLTNPIWVVRTRIMVQSLHPDTHHYASTNPFVVMREMVRAEGYSSLVRGLVPSMFSIINAGIFFPLYEAVRGEGPAAVFVASAFAKAVSSTVTYPLIVVRTILHDAREIKRVTFLNTIRNIWGSYGVRGFYSGLLPDLIRIIPSNAILFVAYEGAKKYLE